MKNTCLVSILVSLAMIVGCASNQEVLINHFKQTGEILKQYEKGKNQFLIVREETRIWKYRIYEDRSDSTSFSKSEIIYVYDELINSCYIGEQAQTKISCNKLCKDQDMKIYINC